MVDHLGEASVGGAAIRGNNTEGADPGQWRGLVFFIRILVATGVSSQYIMDLL